MCVSVSGCVCLLSRPRVCFYCQLYQSVYFRLGSARKYEGEKVSLAQKAWETPDYR